MIEHSVNMQVYERAMEVYGSEEEMENARLKKVERREKQQQKKFDKNVQGYKFDIICNKYQNKLLLQPFYSRLSRITRVSRCRKDKPFRILRKQRWWGWQWHQLDYVQVICTSLQTDNHESTSSLHIFYRPDALLATPSKH